MIVISLALLPLFAANPYLFSLFADEQGSWIRNAAATTSVLHQTNETVPNPRGVSVAPMNSTVSIFNKAWHW